MALIKKDLFCQHYPALVSVDWDRMLPSVMLVEERMLRRVVLGPKLYLTLHEEWSADTRYETMSERMVDLHKKCMKPLAYLAVYEAIPELSANFTSAGLRQNVGEGESPAPMWLSNQARDAALSKGHAWLDTLIEFLVEKKEKYPEWNESLLYSEVHESLIATMIPMDRHTRILGSAWLLHQLRPAMRTLQQGVVRTVIGQARLDELLTRVHGGGLNGTDNTLLDALHPAMLYGALAEEAAALRINVDRSGVYTFEGSDRFSNRVERPATGDQLTALVRNCRQKHEYFLDEARKLVAPNGGAEPSLGGTGSVFRS